MLPIRAEEPRDAAAIHRVHAAAFSTDAEARLVDALRDVNELIAFNPSPLGQKVLHKMPQLVQRSLENTQQVLREMEPELQRRLRKIMVELQERYIRRRAG